MNGSSHFSVSYNLDMSLLKFRTVVKALEIANCEWNINIESLGSRQLPKQLSSQEMKGEDFGQRTTSCCILSYLSYCCLFLSPPSKNDLSP